MICPKCGEKALYREESPIDKKTWFYVHEEKIHDNPIYGRFKTVTKQCGVPKRKRRLHK